MPGKKKKTDRNSQWVKNKYVKYVYVNDQDYEMGHQNVDYQAKIMQYIG